MMDLFSITINLRSCFELFCEVFLIRTLLLQGNNRVVKIVQPANLKQKRDIAPNFKGTCAREDSAAFSEIVRSVSDEYLMRKNNSGHISILIDPQNVGTHLNRREVVMRDTRLMSKFQSHANIPVVFPTHLETVDCCDCNIFEGSNLR